MQNQINKIAKKHNMYTDVKKSVFSAIVNADDYLQAFESLMRLNLKKTQQREIVRVLVHCCLSEKSFNEFYGLLATKLLKYDSQNYKYTFKYTLWDYLKSLNNQSVTKIVNLSKLTGNLIATGSIPIDFLKVIDFPT